MFVDADRVHARAADRPARHGPIIRRCDVTERRAARGSRRARDRHRRVGRAQDERRAERRAAALATRGSSALPLGSPARSRCAALLPAADERRDYVIRVGIDTLIYMLLALGLNVVVGWAGLLDLGYVAFFGFGAYGYALLSSDQFGLHWPSSRRCPDRGRRCAALLGLVARPAVAAAARRLPGDRDAVLRADLRTCSSNATGSTSRRQAVNFTGGPNGIPGIDPIDVLGVQDRRASAQLLLPRCSASSWSCSSALCAAQQLAHRAGVARAARGPAGGRADGIPVNRLKLLGVRVRRGDGRADRDDLRRRCRRASSRPNFDLAAADHDLRDGDPRRRRAASPASIARRDRDQRRRSSCSRDPEHGALAVLRRDPRRARRQAAALAEARCRARRDGRVRLRAARDRRRRVVDAATAGDARRAATSATHRRRLGAPAGEPDADREHRLRRRSSRAVLALTLVQGCVADASARPDALPRGVRLGEPAGRPSRSVDAADAPRRAAVVLMNARPQGLLGDGARGDRLMARAARAARGLEALRRPAGDPGSRPRRSTRARSSA